MCTVPWFIHDTHACISYHTYALDMHIACTFVWFCMHMYRILYVYVSLAVNLVRSEYDYLIPKLWTHTSTKNHKHTHMLHVHVHLFWPRFIHTSMGSWSAVQKITYLPTGGLSLAQAFNVRRPFGHPNSVDACYDCCWSGSQNKVQRRSGCGSPETDGNCSSFGVPKQIFGASGGWNGD